MDDLSEHLPRLLFLLGVALQWARAESKFRDTLYYLSAVALALIGYALTTSLHDQHWKAELVYALLALERNVPMVLSGTFVMSGLAKAAAKSGANVEHRAIPLTNSK